MKLFRGAAEGAGRAWAGLCAELPATGFKTCNLSVARFEPDRQRLRVAHPRGKWPLLQQFHFVTKHRSVCVYSRYVNIIPQIEEWDFLKFLCNKFAGSRGEKRAEEISSCASLFCVLTFRCWESQVLIDAGNSDNVTSTQVVRVTQTTASTQGYAKRRHRSPDTKLCE